MSHNLQLHQLATTFSPHDFFKERCGSGYQLLPARFIRLDTTRVVLTNLVGEFVVIEREVLASFIRHTLSKDTAVFSELKSKHFLIEEDSTVALDLLSLKYRTKQSHLSQLTALYIFVVTLRCDHSCPYCQVSRRSTNTDKYDMKSSSAQKAVDIMFQSPSKTIKVEFQGGEPFLCFERIREIVDLVSKRNHFEGRDIAFVIATTLAYLSDDILEYCAANNISLSTSLDGPQDIHNANRPRPDGDSYQKAVAGIRWARARLGNQGVSALMTTTHNSLRNSKEIVDEYLKQGFESIFLRPLSPFGFAVKTGLVTRVSMKEWIQFYKESLDYILSLNLQGIYFREEYACLLLRKILTPFPTSFVDLQSPAGIGIGALVFNYDGAIYASDESRMLAENGDMTFRLGHVESDSYSSIIASSAFISMLRQSFAESAPMCSDCGFLPYCGSDPVYHHATQDDLIGKKPLSGFCQRNMEILRYLFTLIADNPRETRILRDWAYEGGL
jgi:His-Xaa-Ser system radical SAM maturase HxsB